MATLSDAQRAALAARLRQSRKPAAAGIPRRGPEVRELPLSFGQEQLWFIDQLAPGQAVYNTPSALRLRGPLDVAALGRALDDLLARHEVLRTRLVNVDGQPRQVIDPPLPRPLQVDDLSGGDEAGREARLRELSAREANRPFDLAAGPLCRARLVRLAADDHLLLVCTHHTVFDGWSLGVLIRELAALYQAQAGGRRADLPDLPVQFADYALWERGRLQGEVLDELVGYWRETLDGAASVQLPTDRPRPPLQDFDGGVERLDVGASLLDGLRALARREGATLFVVLLTAIQVLLHRYSGQSDVTVGTASANRTRPELAPLIGYLVNTLPIRTDTSGDPTFVELLQRVRTRTVEAYAHQDLPFARLVEALRVERDPSRSPVFQVGFTMAESPDEETRAGEVSIRLEGVELLPAKIDLNFFVETGPDGMRLVLSYATALFDAGTAGRMLGHLRELLSGIVADPDRTLSRLPLLSAAETRRELVEWNDTDADLPTGCMHHAFAEQAARTPAGTAAVFGDERWTYSELDTHANRVARALRRRGVEAERLVGISMRPSLRRLAVVLGVLKAGGGYVPLDPELPPERLAYMVEDAGVRTIVTDAGAGSLQATGAELVDLDDHWPSIAGEAGDDPGCPVSPDNVAYVIYTSGSTGRPKGVVVQHGTVVNYLAGMIRHWPVRPGDRCLQFASLSFDVSVMDMFVALCSGAAAVFGTAETLHSPHRLAELMRRQRVTFACLPPAVVNLLAGESLPDLRVLISAGEALSADLVRSWLRPGLVFCNGYGPTETTCGVTLMPLDASTPLPPPIGRPMPNYRAYVLDAHLGPLPQGAIGELHVGGLCLARGYLDRPALTAERFVPDPHSGRPGARLYRTGDLVRRLPDGTIQFVGRADTQVKIRGLRVELGEIETALTAHPAVAQAIVIAADDATGQKQLVGYARTDPGVPAPVPADLRQHLARQLPAYMIPAHIVLLDAFPLTPSGKIDVRALPPPETAGGSHVAPRTLVETLLVDLYASLLGGVEMGIDDSFFDLGGNSLQAMQLVTRLHTELAVDADVTAVFLAPTPRQLASLLREQHGLEDEELGEVGLDDLEPAPAAAEAPPSPVAGSGRLVALAGGTGRPLFVVHAIGGTVFPYAQLAKELADAFQVHGVEAGGLVEGVPPVASLDEMVAAYVAAVRAAQPSGPYRLAGWSMGGVVAFEIAGRLEALGETVALLVLMDTPFALPPDPPSAESDLAALFVADVARTLGWAADDSPSGGDRLGWLAARLDAGAGAAGAVRADLERRFDVFKANTRAIAGYRPGTTVRAPALIAGAEGSWDTAPDWRTVLTGPVRALRVPGEHWTLLQAPGAERIAEAVLAWEPAIATADTAR